MEDVEVNEYGEVIFTNKSKNADAFNMWLDAIEEKENDKKVDKK